MGHLAIRVERLGKQYRLGGAAARDTIYETLGSALAAPFRRAAGHAGRAAPRTFWALRDVTFDLHRGEVLGVIGRNGAGKSTLLKILSRVIEPDEGAADLYGRVGSLLEVGTGFHPELSGRENILLNGAILGMRRAEILRRFDEIVAFAEVDTFLDTPVKYYSTGMYLRLAFAVAAHLEPDILLVDEVLAVGDAAFQRKCLGKMSRAAQGGRTILFVTHNLGAVRSFCRDCALLDEGRLVRVGPSAEVVDDYLKACLGPVRAALDLAAIDRRPGMGERLRLLRLELNRGEAIRHGAPFSACVEYEADGEVPGLSVGLGFSTLDGTRLITMDSDLQSERREVHRAARGRALLHLELLHLQPGRYSLDVGARSGDSLALDYLPACAEVEVLPGEQTPGMLIRDGGGVRLPAEWSWQEDLRPDVEPRERLPR